MADERDRVQGEELSDDELNEASGGFFGARFPVAFVCPACGRTVEYMFGSTPECRVCHKPMKRMLINWGTPTIWVRADRAPGACEEAVASVRVRNRTLVKGFIRVHGRFVLNLVSNLG